MQIYFVLIIGIFILYKINKDIISGIKWSIIYLYFIEWLLFNILYFDNSVKIVEDFIVWGIFLKTIKNYGYNKSNIPGYLKFLIILIFSTTLLSTFINASSVVAFILGLRRLLVFFVLLYSFSKIRLTEIEQKNILKYFYVAGLIQLPFVLLEYFFWAKIAPVDRPGLGVGQDANTGTFPFSGQQALSVFLIFVILFLIGVALYNKNTSILKTLAIVAYLSISLPFASSGGAIVVAAVTFLFFLIILIFTYYKFSIYRIIYFAVPIIIIGFIFYYITTNIYQGQLDYLFDFQSLASSQSTMMNSGGDQGRIAVLVFLWSKLIHGGQLLFGYGPGNFLASDYTGQAGSHFDPNLLMAGRVQVTALLGEVGLITTSLIVLLFLIILIYLFKNYMKEGNDKLINISGFNFILIFLGCFMYISVLGSIQLVFPITIYLAIVFQINNTSNYNI
jgi:hypothetical protein